MNQTNIKRFESLLQSVEREGMEGLIAFIRKSDFYTAPASTRFHSCHEGGLLEHSLNVYDCLINKLGNPTWNCLENIEKDSLIITALLHDLCKTYFYSIEMKNKKVYSDMGKKIDDKGRFDWVAVPAYTIDDMFPYGHGEKSVMMIEEFIKLTPQERYTIRWHMGWTEPKESYNAVGSSMRKYPLVLALHESDQEATYLMEKEE